MLLSERSRRVNFIVNAIFAIPEDYDTPSSDIKSIGDEDPIQNNNTQSVHAFGEPAESFKDIESQ